MQQQQAMYNNPQYAMQVDSFPLQKKASNSLKYSDAAVLRKYGTAIPWRSCSSSTNVPGTTWGGAVSRVKPFKMLKEERECKLGISVWKKVEVKKFLISEQSRARETKMDLGDLVASAEQLTAEIDGVSSTFQLKEDIK